ncbi:metal-dependent hydrolase [Halostella sp. JP-L12]|uniref:metal-dependent hydrolase n=1 Tax=Halostella TaxID=1843185 RepID=UPI000EF81184|nr:MULTISPECIES: metal-dependent hydrolase [Halostella]NHN48416.1 metal-dependent hydrolase [Halostella sp. JP-L12]
MLTERLVDGYTVFLAGAIATHALVGYVLGRSAFGAGAAGLVGGVLADADFLFPGAWGFPLVHRGITHSALALGVAAAAVAVARDRRAGAALALGYASHLAIDATTPKGVPLLYPVADASYAVTINLHSAPATAALWICCLTALAAGRLCGRPTPS